MMECVRAGELYKYNAEGWLRGKIVEVVAPVNGPQTKVNLSDGRFAIIDSRKLSNASSEEIAAWKK